MQERRISMPPNNPYILVSIPSQSNNAYSSGDSSVQQGVLLTGTEIELHSPAKSILVASYVPSYHALMLFWIVFDVEAFQLYELIEPKFTEGDTLSRVLPARPSKILRV